MRRSWVVAAGLVLGLDRLASGGRPAFGGMNGRAGEAHSVDQ